jgi:hypothetical protein
MDWKTELLLAQAAREFSRPYRLRQEYARRSWSWLDNLDPDSEEAHELDMLIQEDWHGSR